MPTKKKTQGQKVQQARYSVAIIVTSDGSFEDADLGGRDPVEKATANGGAGSSCRMDPLPARTTRAVGTI